MLWFFLFFLCFVVLAYHRAALSIWTISFFLLLLFCVRWSGMTVFPLALIGLGFAVIFSFLGFPFLRLCITRRLFLFYRTQMPAMSRTEKEALAAGTVSWDGELFRGNPDCNQLLSIAPPQLSQDEKDFLEGPVEELCSRIDEWDISHRRADLPKELWQFIIKNGFW